MASTERKGDLAELKVACDLVERGYRVAIPFGEDSNFDLILIREDDSLERVQVKYTESDGSIMEVRCQSHSLTNGKVRRTKQYTSATVDWIASYDRISDSCYYIPARELGSGVRSITLRLAPTANGQRLKIRYASDYTAPEKRSQISLEPPA